MFESLRESVRSGSKGAAWEARLYCSDCGFELEEIQVDRLSLFGMEGWMSIAPAAWRKRRPN